jgi:hypothetical protein
MSDSAERSVDEGSGQQRSPTPKNNARADFWRKGLVNCFQTLPSSLLHFPVLIIESAGGQLLDQFVARLSTHFPFPTVVVTRKA